MSAKIKLYETIKKLIPIGIKYIPKTYTITEFETGDLPPTPANMSGDLPPPTYILKKINTGQQKGVRVFYDKNKYLSIKKELNINAHNAIIMDYITNPALTVDGKKFHLRIHVLLIVESGIKRCYIRDAYKILTANSVYKKDDWLNKDIHISCGTTTDREHKFPDDIATKIDYKKFNEFKKTMAFAVAFNDSIIYEENDIGYMIYGVDVLMTDDNNFFILEFNGTGIGHTIPKSIRNTPDANIYKIRYSKEYFSFVLNSTVFPALGIKRRPIPVAEVCGYGVLSPFFNILTGDNRCTLIPYTDASDEEIESAKKIYFHNKLIMLTELLKICNLHNIFLIGMGNKSDRMQSLEKQPLRSGTNQPIEKQHQNKQPLRSGTNQPIEKQHQNKQPLRSESDAYASGCDAYASGSGICIGYIALCRNNYLTIAVMEEYQNRGIATAMIAQFL